MEQEYPFRPRGRHGFDRDDVINYIGQAKLQCQEHLARLEETETAKAAWYTQAKSLESEKATLVSRNQELEEQVERAGSAPQEAPGWLTQEVPYAADSQELSALKARCIELEQQLAAEKENTAALQVEKAQWEDHGEENYAATGADVEAMQEQLAQQEAAAQAWMHRIAALEQENAALEHQLRTAGESQQAQDAARQAAYDSERAALQARAEALEDTVAGEKAALDEQLTALEAQVAAAEGEKATLAEQLAATETEKSALAEQLAALEAEKATLTAQLANLESEKAALAAQLAAAEHLKLEKENLALRIAALEQEKGSFETQLPGLEERLATLTAAVETAQTDSAQRIAALEQEKAALVDAKAALEQAQAAQAQALAVAEQEKAAQSERTVAAEQENYRQAKRIAALEQAESAARQAQATLTTEADTLRAQVSDLERFSGEKNADVLRSMVLASFNYSNLYVENNLKTAQVITDATSRNIGRVSESASSMLEQLDTIGRSFNDTTDTIRRNLANFQRELDSIQNGMNKRLSQDRFSPLLEENERLRERLETELLAELSTDEETPVRSSPEHNPDGASLPFAEDLPKSFHDFLD
ncbi:MAG: hypothetical protein LBS96_02685 [Oscillospiraceae bacterium]|nr:hypothetical protein [Oscillospiraceae bacterium]